MLMFTSTSEQKTSLVACIADVEKQNSKTALFILVDFFLPFPNNVFIYRFLGYELFPNPSAT